MTTTESITVNGTVYNVIKREDYQHNGANRVCYHAKKAVRGRGIFYIIRYENGTYSKPQGITNFGIEKLRKALAAATAKSARLSEARRALPPGSSRARVTTANARWARAAEERDRLLTQLEQLSSQSVEK